MKQSYDFIIVGAGIVGLSAARELARRNAGSVLVLEKEGRLGVHSSGRNSGVLHAGIYYNPDSLKARVCVKGQRMMLEYAAERGIPGHTPEREQLWRQNQEAFVQALDDKWKKDGHFRGILE